jgi:hypothetical protein
VILEKKLEMSERKVKELERKVEELEKRVQEKSLAERDLEEGKIKAEYLKLLEGIGVVGSESR